MRRRMRKGKFSSLLSTILLPLVLLLLPVVTTTLPAATAQQEITSPIQPSTPIEEGIKGPATFVDLENFGHVTGFSIYVPADWLLDHLPTNEEARTQLAAPFSQRKFEEAATLCQEELSVLSAVTTNGKTYHCGAHGSVAASQVSVRMYDIPSTTMDPLDYHMAILSEETKANNIDVGTRILNITDTPIEYVDSVTNQTTHVLPAKLANIQLTYTSPRTGDFLVYINTVLYTTVVVDGTDADTYAISFTRGKIQPWERESILDRLYAAEVVAKEVFESFRIMSKP